MNNGPELYHEWQRPWLPGVYLGAMFAAIAAVGVGLGFALDGEASLFGLWLIIATGAFGVVLALISARTIRLYSDSLRIGTKNIPLAAVTDTTILRGRELWRVRNRIVMPRSKASPLLLGGAIPIPGLSVAFVGGYLIATRAIRNGNCCSPGQGPALALVTPSLRTPLWVVGSRYAEQLLTAVDRARAALAVDEVAVDKKASGWLPPPRER